MFEACFNDCGFSCVKVGNLRLFMYGMFNQIGIDIGFDTLGYPINTYSFNLIK